MTPLPPTLPSPNTTFSTQKSPLLSTCTQHTCHLFICTYVSLNPLARGGSFPNRPLSSSVCVSSSVFRSFQLTARLRVCWGGCATASVVTGYVGAALGEMFLRRGAVSQTSESNIRDVTENRGSPHLSRTVCEPRPEWKFGLRRSHSGELLNKQRY